MLGTFLQVVTGLIAGLGIFLYGMHYMTEGLQRLAGPRLRLILTRATSNRFAGIGAGLGLTALVQSSSATTVAAVGFVNAGLLTLRQAIGIIMGANIGTTVTAWIMGIRITEMAWLFIGLGCVLALFTKNKRTQRIGQAILGLGFLFYGMTVMKNGVAPLKGDESVKKFVEHFSQNPIWGLFAGIVITCLFQSSSATIGLAISLSTVGLLPLNAAIPIIIGDNIGTTITAQLAALGTRVESRRAAMSHTLFNVFGACWALPLSLTVYPAILQWIMRTPYTPENSGIFIAIAHSGFNLANTILFVGLIGFLERASVFLVKGKEAGPICHLERHLLDQPATALALARRAKVDMMKCAHESVTLAVEGLLKTPPALCEDEVHVLEKRTDAMQREITIYLAALAQRELTSDESDQIPTVLHSVNDLERISDHALNISQAAERLATSGENLSDEQRDEIRQMYEVLNDMFRIIPGALLDIDLVAAQKALDLEKKIDRYNKAAGEKYLTRLQEGSSTYLPGMIYLNVTANLEKIGDHLTNIAQAAQRQFHYNAPRVRDVLKSSFDAETKSKAS